MRHEGRPSGHGTEGLTHTIVPTKDDTREETARRLALVGFMLTGCTPDPTTPVRAKTPP